MDTFNMMSIDLESVDYVSLGLVALPIVAIILCGFLLLGKSKNDTMQRSGSKASHNTKSQKDSQHSHHHHHHNHNHLHSKNDSSDSGISTNGHHHHHHQQQQQGSSSIAAKQRKSRSSSKRQDVSVEQKKRAAGGFSVDDWLGRDMVYCYERRYISSCAEDNMMARHNPAHRNSTSSDAAASDDLNSSSSNEDLSAVYTVMSKTSKKSTKSRQKRQQKRKQQQQANNQQTHQPDHEDTPMEIDEESKENQRPASDGPQQKIGSAASNLRKQCTKAAALKAANNKHHNNTGSGSSKSNSANVLSTSSSNSSVCSALSAASSTSSIPSSVASSAASSPTNSANSSPTASPTVAKRNADNFKKIARALAPPLRQHTKLNLTECELIQQLRRYIIDPNLLRVYGYPVESAIHEGCIEIYKCLPKPFSTHLSHHQSSHSSTNVINTNDGLYTTFSNSHTLPSHEKQWGLNESNISSGDSGQGSGDSSPPSVDSDSSEVGEDEPTTGTTAFYTPDGSYQIFSQYDQSLEKQCVRCKRAFHVTESGDYLTREACLFHWGKLNHMYTGKGFGYSYSCCEGDQNSEGCTHNPLHVWTGAVVGLNGPYIDFVHTRPRYCPDALERRPEPTKVYALDCEMSFTGRGLEVTKITVVGYDGQLVYEHFVRPQAEIVDYNTRFSGITEKDLSTHASNPNLVKTLTEVQRDLLQLFDADTILIGHGLDNDLRVLRIVHKTIIDTSIAFPHASGFPYRRALKHLTKVCLNRDIQCGDAGHSSFEDSRACLELMLWKVRKEFKQ